METELHIWHKCKHNLTCFTNTESSNKCPHLDALASVRSLIINNSTSDETISQIFEVLAQSLQQGQEPFLHHILKLLLDLANHHSHLSQLIFDNVYAFASRSRDASHLTVEALKVLVMIASHNQSSKKSTISVLNEELFRSLCVSSSASVRSWLLQNAKRFHVPKDLLVPVLLGFTKDPYPYVRRDALGSLVGLCKLGDFNGPQLIKECYDRAVELLLDMNEFVRSMAIRVVGEWGHMLAVLDSEVDSREWCDAVFAQLCSMARDMSVEVRSETFIALGQVKVVSDDILLQTLSKKILGIMKDRKIFGRFTTIEFNLPPSNVAGVFLHGLEDEFSEVRSSACKSLGMLTIISAQFANNALDLLMDILNDDSMTVRLQSLETMHHMATCHCLDVQETHMHMFLGTLVDTNSLIRHAARNILHLLRSPTMEIFKSSISALLTNLETYPEDEDDILSVIFRIGQSHAKYAISFVKDCSSEIGPSCEGELCLDQARVVAILVLAISASVSHEQHIHKLPIRIFSYAIPFLGRIAHALRDVTDQDSLLAYLCHCSQFLHVSAPFREDELILPVVDGGTGNDKDKERINQAITLLQVSYGTESQFQNNLWDPRDSTLAQEYQQKVDAMHKEAINSVKIILRVVAETWPLIKSGLTEEARRTLRTCKEELATISASSHESVGLLAFASQYIGVFQLLTKVWEYFFPRMKFPGSETRILDYLLEKLDTNLRGLRYRFPGLSNEEKLHVLELILLSFVLRLSKVEICCHLNMLKRLHSTVSHIELLCGGVLEHSEFVRELKSFFQGISLDDEASYHILPFERLLEPFTLKQVAFSGQFKHIKAELDFPGNISENALPFISGLPVGITFQITLYNISAEDQLWLTMTVEEQTQYVFLNLSQIEAYEIVSKLTVTVPFYRTPKALSFSIRTCIGKECPFEDAPRMAQVQGGPKHKLVFLCKEKKVYLVLKS